MVMIIAVLVVFGLCLGSFVNALVWRLHQQGQAEKNPRSKRQKVQNLSIVNGRSICVHCGHELNAPDLVPVFSWLFLMGKCRYCSQPISWHYPAVEMATAGLFVFSYLYWPSDLATLSEWIHFGTWLVILTGFMALVVYDLKWMLLPNRIIYPMLVIALALVAYLAAASDTGLLVDTLYSVLVAGGIFFLLFQVSGGKWIGGGDVKLGLLIGLLLLNVWHAFLMLLFASMLGTLVILPALATGRAKVTSRIPFGPFLIVSAIIVKLFGAGMIAWYKRYLGL